VTIGSQRDLQVRLGFASETGKRAANEDYVAACLGQTGAFNRDIVAAVVIEISRHDARAVVRICRDALVPRPQTVCRHDAERGIMPR